MKFSYKGRNKEGAITTGVVEGRDRVEAINTIRNLGVVPLLLTKPLVASLQR